MNYSKLFKILAAAGDNVRKIDADDVLERMGLERRPSTIEKVLTTLGIFGAGMVIGAGVGLLVSPVAPEDVRKKISAGAKTVKSEIQNLVAHAEEEVSATGSSLLSETPGAKHERGKTSHAS
jgi:hypothetical protein